MEPLVSAIVSTYRSERFIRACIEDLEAQTIAGRLEIIVIDSASPQNEGEIVRELQQRYTNIRYIRTAKRETLYKAWNRGIEQARGRYLTNANTDDRHRRDALEVLSRALDEHPEAAFAYADALVTLDENTTWDAVDPVVRMRWPEFDRRLLFQVGYLGAQPMWRRDLHDRYGLFDPAFIAAGDYEFWLRVGVKETFLHVPEPVGLYLAAPGSIEHRRPDLIWTECELARLRYWPAEWGKRPKPRGVFMRPDVGRVMREMARGRVGPLRELARHARMLVDMRLRR